jgi:hypothetical protein
MPTSSRDHGQQHRSDPTEARAYYRPPYVGVKGWVGIELARVTDARLEHHLHEAWRMVAPKRDRDAMGTPKAGVPVSRRRASRRTPARRTTDRSP